MARRSISLAQARRLALGAQGFSRARPVGRIDKRHLRRVFDNVGIIQIDSVNVLARSQELVVFARLGPHPRSLIEEATANGEIFEYWVHEASHVPTDQHYLYRWAMQQPHRWGAFRNLIDDRPDLLDSVMQRVTEHGPIVASDLKQRVGKKGPWWDYDDGKIAVEALFREGRLTATRRSSDFARLYDLPERVIPADALDRPSLPEADARKELLRMAAEYHGIGTANDLIDYHRQHIPSSRPLIAELVEDGRLVEVDVESWEKPGYMAPSTNAIPRKVSARALLSPFDPVVWNRERAERLFGFRYRIEIYVPKPKRQYGYYVLPFLLGDQLVGRVDLKADRANGTLLVQSAWAEPGTAEHDVARELYEELSLMAGWLELERVEIVGAGDLSPALARAAPRAPSATHA